MLQRGDVVPVPQRLVLQIGHEPGQFGVALRDHEPEFPVIEGEQPIVRAHPLTFEHVDRPHVGGHRRGQVREAEGSRRGRRARVGVSRSPARPP